jgi:hypothetical protein
MLTEPAPEMLRDPTGLRKSETVAVAVEPAVEPVLSCPERLRVPAEMV